MSKCGFWGGMAVSLAVALSPLLAQAGENGGTITGMIKVSRTKVKTKGPKSYKHVVVFLETEDGGSFPDPVKHAEMDQKGLTFIPHVIAVQKGTTVDFLNNDSEIHNVYFLFDSSGKQINLGNAPPGKVLSYKFDTVDTATVLCKLHLEMAAYVVVLPNPYFTVAKIDGDTQQASYTIKNVPPGKYTIKAWHKKLKLKGGSKEVVVENGKTATVDLTITKKKYAK